MPTKKKRWSRRSYVKYGGSAVGLAGLAGCLGNGDDDGASDGNENGGGNGDDDGNGADDGSGTDEDELEDELVYYGSSNRPEMFEAFEERTGVTVNPVIAGGYEPLARFESEEERDEHQADILQQPTWIYFQEDLWDYFADIDLWEEKRDELDAEFVDLVEEKAPEESLSKWAPMERSNFGHAYAEGRVDPVESYEDLLRSDMEDNIIAPAFVLHSVAYYLDQRWEEDEVDQFFLDLDDHGVRYAGPPTSGVVDDVIAGERDMAFAVVGESAIAPRIAEGAPIELTGLGLTGAFYTSIAVSANAPNPNAARAFAEFALSEEGQAAQAQSGPGRDSVLEAIDHGNEDFQRMLDENDIVQIVRTPEEIDHYQDKMDELLDI